MIINAHSQSKTHSETTRTYSKISEKKEEVIKNKILYKKSIIEVEYNGNADNMYDYSMNSPSGNELEINIIDDSNKINFVIIENDNHLSNNGDNALRVWKGIYKNNIIIRVNTKEKDKKYSFSLVIMEKVRDK